MILEKSSQIHFFDYSNVCFIHFKTIANMHKNAHIFVENK